MKQTILKEVPMKTTKLRLTVIIMFCALLLSSLVGCAANPTDNSVGGSGSSGTVTTGSNETNQAVTESPQDVLESFIQIADAGDHSNAYAMLGDILSEFTSDELMAKANSLISNKNFDAAYVILSLTDTQEAKSLLESFTLLVKKEFDIGNSGYLIHTYNDNGKILKTQFASENDLMTVVDYIDYTYDGKGYLIKKQDHCNECDYTYTYDTKGRLIEERSVFQNDICLITYEYNDNNNVVKQTVSYNNLRSKKVITEYQYNKNNDVVKVTETTLMTPATIEGVLYKDYTMDVKVSINEYDSKGNLIKTTDSLNNYLTDSSWNVTEDLGKPYADNIFTYEYNSKGQLVKKDYTDGVGYPVTYEYDGSGRLITRKSANEKVEYTYNEAGLLVLESHVSDQVTQSFVYTYDCYGNLLKKESKHNNKTSIAEDITYTYFYNL